MTILMTTSRTALGALALALAPALWPSGAMAQDACFDEATDLIAGQTINVGDVNVCNDAATLTVTYELTSPWCLLATRLHVATSEDDIPQNGRGHPRPDQFDHGDDYDPCVDTATFAIDLAAIGDDGVEPGNTVVIAAHAEVMNTETLEEEGAWGAGTRFVERGNWATYFTYEVQEATCGETSRCVFVTSSSHNGNLGGLAVADAICQARADAEGSLAAPGTYKAWLSTAAESAASRLTHAEVPYKRVDGTTIADDWTDLTDGSLDALFDVTETGGRSAVALARTGTSASGSHRPPDCAAWTSASREVNGLIGSLLVSSGQWTEAFAGRCDTGMVLYCLQQ